MRAIHVGMAVAAVSVVARLVVACGSAPLTFPHGTDGGTGAVCQTNEDCYAGGGDCTAMDCDLGKCVEHDLAAGTVAPSPEINAGVCQRVVCDGHGNETVEPDPHVLPSSTGAYCVKPACDDAGNATTAPDPSNVPPGPAAACSKNGCDDAGNMITLPDPSNVPTSGGPACKKASCDDAGHTTYSPDPSNVPDATPGTCTSPMCDDAGNVVAVADPTNPPPTSGCMAYTCNGSTPVEMTAVGATCSQFGLVCDTGGQCDVCPVLTATCTDPGPAGSAHSLGTAYTFGSIGFCDADGAMVCDTIQGGGQAWYSYTSNAGFDFCTYGPNVAVQSTVPVTLCEYFVSSGVACPSGSTTATDADGDSGCCITTVNGSMSITADDDEAQTYIEVEATTDACVGFMMSYHS